ncbi:MAG: TrmH family RNA methyltransferase [bacterium]
MSDAPGTDYQSRRAFFDRLLTVYGRKPVLEALENPDIECFRLHLADSNKSGGIISDIIEIAKTRQIEIVYHSRAELSRISRNQKQDQGVAADMLCPKMKTLDDFLESPGIPFQLIALDGVTNPQNLGMIIRSVAASPVDGLLLSKKGNAEIDPLVIKASAGTVFRCPIIRCDSLLDALKRLQRNQGENNSPLQICSLSLDADQTLGEFSPQGSVIYVLGNETDGVSREVADLCNHHLKIPMHNGVESLNVAVTAALVAFRGSC